MSKHVPPSRQGTDSPLTTRQYAQAVAMAEEVRTRCAVREALKQMMIHTLPLGADEESCVQWIDSHYPPTRIEILDHWLGTRGSE